MVLIPYYLHLVTIVLLSWKQTSNEAQQYYRKRITIITNLSSLFLVILKQERMDLSFAAVNIHPLENYTHTSSNGPQFNTVPLALAKTKNQHPSQPLNDDYLDNIITFRKKCNQKGQYNQDHSNGGTSFPISILSKSSLDPRICQQRAITELFDQSDQLQRQGEIRPEGRKLKTHHLYDEHSSLSAFNQSEARYLRQLLSTKNANNSKEFSPGLNQSSQESNVYLKMWNQYKNKISLKQKLTRKISKTQDMGGDKYLSKYLSEYSNDYNRSETGPGEYKQVCGHGLKPNKKAREIKTRKHSHLLDTRNVKEIQREKLLKWRSESQQILKDSFCYGMKMSLKEPKSKQENYSPLENLPINSNFPQKNSESQKGYFLKSKDNLLKRKSSKKIETKKKECRNRSLIYHNEDKEGKTIDLIEGISISKTNQIKQLQQNNQEQKKEKCFPKVDQLLFQPRNSGSNCIKSKIASIFKKLNIHHRNQSICSPKDIENSLKIRAKSNVQTSKEINQPIKKKKPFENIIKLSQSKQQLNQSIIHSIKIFSESRKTRNVLQLLGQERFRLKRSGNFENRSASMLVPLV